MNSLVVESGFNLIPDSRLGQLEELFSVIVQAVLTHRVTRSDF
jgi:hypothetical protein